MKAKMKNKQYEIKETFGLNPVVWGPFETLEAAEAELAQLKKLTGVYVPHLPAAPQEIKP